MTSVRRPDRLGSAAVAWLLTPLVRLLDEALDRHLLPRLRGRPYGETDDHR